MISRRAGMLDDIHAMELATRLFSTISFLLSLTHRAFPNVLFQESAGIGCEHFKPRIPSG